MSYDTIPAEMGVDVARVLRTLADTLDPRCDAGTFEATGGESPDLDESSPRGEATASPGDVSTDDLADRILHEFDTDHDWVPSDVDRVEISRTMLGIVESAGFGPEATETRNGLCLAEAALRSRPELVALFQAAVAAYAGAIVDVSRLTPESPEALAAELGRAFDAITGRKADGR